MPRMKSQGTKQSFAFIVCFSIVACLRLSGIALAQSSQTNLAVTVRHAPSLNGGGLIEGSIQQLLGESVTLNGRFALTGDLLVPGTPTLLQNGHPDFAGTMAGSGGSAPDGYQVTLNGNCSLRYLRTRTTPVFLPTVTAPPQPTGTRSVTISSAGEAIGDPATLRHLTLNGNAGQFAIPPGTYGNFTANSGSGFTLGVAGTTQPAIYNLQNLTLNGQTRLEVISPVILTVAKGFTANGGVGSTSNPSFLQLHLAAGGFTLNGGCIVHGNVTAPAGTVIINGNSLLVGSAQCDRLIVNSGGIIRASAMANQVPAADAQNLAMAEDSSLTVTLTGSDAEGANLPLAPQSFSFDANDWLNTDSYDANGNTLLGAGFSQTQADQYDFENRLVSRVATINSQPTTINIWYDGDGNRVKKTVVTPTNTVTTFFVVDELNPSGYAQVLEEHVSLNSQPSTLNCIYTYGHTLISQDRLDGATWLTSFYGYDGHNNVRYLTHLNGNVTDTYDYDAFGNVIAASGNTSNLYLFTGEQYDLDLGFYYLRARYHNTDTGRFWTQDSFEGNGSDPASLHKYTYCGNNPANAYDPRGNFSITEMAHVGMIGGLTTAWVGSISRALGAALGGGGWTGLLEAANNGIAEDFTSGFVGGILGCGVGKAAFWAIGRAAPYLLRWTPDAVLSGFNTATARLGKAWQTAEAAWAKLEQEIVQGTQAAAQLARNAVAEAEARVAQLSDSIGRIRATLGWGEEITAAKNPVSIGHWPDYIDMARFLGTQPFDVPLSVWEKMNPAEKWAANERFLEQAIARGDSFFLSTPLRSLQKINRLTGEETGFWKEIQYLILKGYRLSSDGRFLVPSQP